MKAFLLTGPKLQTLPRSPGLRIRHIIEPSGRGGEGEGKGEQEGTEPTRRQADEVGTLHEVCLMASRWCYVLPDSKCKHDLVEVAMLSSLTVTIMIIVFNRKTQTCEAYHCWDNKKFQKTRLQH